MEALEKKIIEFLQVSSGDGYGYGDGSGYGSGYGSGDGYGSGSGDGYGDGYGSGDGYGYGYGDGSGSGDGYGDGYGSGDGDGYGDGYGSGDGSGYGYGDGSGYGYGDGYGYGYGDGDGDGYGYGYGDGDGVKEYEGRKIWRVDGVPTLIYSVHGNYAKGAILQSDLTLTPCFIAKVDNFFAHGDTLRSAMNDATAKAMQNMPLEKRIEKFIAEHDKDKKYPTKDLFDWHHILTGSCRAGRESFCRDKGIDIDSGEYSVSDFIKITEHSYGGDAIKKLKPYYL